MKKSPLEGSTVRPVCRLPEALAVPYVSSCSPVTNIHLGVGLGFVLWRVNSTLALSKPASCAGTNSM